jgi:hypothetical protein
MPGRLNGVPHRLQKTDAPNGSGAPQEGQVFFLMTGFCSNVVPQRVQKRDWGSMAGLPQALHTAGSGWIFAPHRLQNCASSSETTVPQPVQTGNAGRFSSGMAAPHRLQNCAWSSSPAWPHLPHFFVMYSSNDKTGWSINTVMPGLRSI